MKKIVIHLAILTSILLFSMANMCGDLLDELADSVPPYIEDNAIDCYECLEVNDTVCNLADQSLATDSIYSLTCSAEEVEISFTKAFPVIDPSSIEAVKQTLDIMDTLGLSADEIVQFQFSFEQCAIESMDGTNLTDMLKSFSLSILPGENAAPVEIISLDQLPEAFDGTTLTVDVNQFPGLMLLKDLLLISLETGQIQNFYLKADATVENAQLDSLCFNCKASLCIASDSEADCF